MINKKYILLLDFYILSMSYGFSCTVCKKNQPEVLQGITHGTGPESQLDYLIVAVMVAVVIGTLIFSIKFLIQPKESKADHIKNSILNPNLYE